MLCVLLRCQSGMFCSGVDISCALLRLFWDLAACSTVGCSAGLCCVLPACVQLLLVSPLLWTFICCSVTWRAPVSCLQPAACLKHAWVTWLCAACQAGGCATPQCALLPGAIGTCPACWHVQDRCSLHPTLCLFCLHSPQTTQPALPACSLTCAVSSAVCTVCFITCSWRLPTPLQDISLHRPGALLQLSAHSCGCVGLTALSQRACVLALSFP